MGKRIVLAAVLIALPASAWADELPRFRGERARVERALVQRGLDPAAARSEAAAMSTQDARFFAESPSSVQSAGHAGEIVIGGCCSCALLLLLLLLA